MSFLDDLGLHEEIAERRMEYIRRRRRENHFRVARDVDRPGNPGPASDVDPAHFDIVFGRNYDLGVRLEIEISAAELCTPLREDRFVVFGLFECGLMRSRPELSARFVA